MKLLYITNGINGPGGLERVLSVKASILADEYNYQVCILCLNDAHKNPFYPFSSKIKFLSIKVGGNPFSYFLLYKKGIQRTINDIQPDIISVCDNGLKAFLLPMILKTNAKIIYERHNSKLTEVQKKQDFFSKNITKFKWFLMDNLAQNFSKFIVLSEGNKNEWGKINNLVEIPNPLSFYSSESSSLENKKVICIGKISYQKGQDLLVQIWEIVHQKFPEWELHIFGSANLDFLDTNNLKHNIFYYPPEKNIEQKYLESSIYVMTSRFEGFGMVLIEAMACGVPCISFDCNYGPSDIIIDGEDGFLVETENIEKFADKITYLIENESKRKRMGKAAKHNVKRFSPDVVVKQWDELFKSLLQ